MPQQIHRAKTGNLKADLCAMSINGENHLVVRIKERLWQMWKSFTIHIAILQKGERRRRAKQREMEIYKPINKKIYIKMDIDKHTDKERETDR